MFASWLWRGHESRLDALEKARGEHASKINDAQTTADLAQERIMACGHAATIQRKYMEATVAGIGEKVEQIMASHVARIEAAQTAHADKVEQARTLDAERVDRKLDAIHARLDAAGVAPRPR